MTWEDAPRTVPPSTAPVLSVDGFEGPLDFLLEMARAQKIDLGRLSIVALVEAFAAALAAALQRGAGAPPADLARWGDWLVMAATVTQLRSRLLLPAGDPEARQAASEAEALRGHIIGRAQMAAAADWLAERPQLGQAVFARGAGTRAAPVRAGDITGLLRACLVALALPEGGDGDRVRAPVLWRLAEAMALVRERLGTLPDGSGLEAFLPSVGGAAPGHALRCRAAVASTFLAGLELARTGELRLDQGGAMTPVLVHRVDASILSF